jgi:hypothetical protein
MVSILGGGVEVVTSGYFQFQVSRGQSEFPLFTPELLPIHRKAVVSEWRQGAVTST